MLLLAQLLLAHLLLDFPLQGDFMAKAKNRHTAVPGVPWLTVMLSHAAIHGLAVTMITGSWTCGTMEFALHFVIDCMKCERMFGFNTDQALHVICKISWACLAGYLP